MHALDPAVGDVDLDHVDETAVRRERAEARLAVDHRGVQRDPGLVGDLVEARQRAGDLRPSDHRLGDRARLPAAVADQDGVRRQHRHERGEVALARGAQEAVRERVALDRVRVEPRHLLLDAPARAAEALAAGIGRGGDDLADLAERHLEGLAQHEHRALVG